MRRLLFIIAIVLFFWTPIQAQQIPASFFGFTETNTSAGNYPGWGNFGSHRYWDSPPLQWPSLNPSSGVFNFSALDKLLAQDYQNGSFQALYDLWRVPTWASSNPTDTTHCHDVGTSPGQGDGECYPPVDLSSNGTGTNAIWKAWVTAIATHANNSDYLNGTGSWGAGGANCPGKAACPHAHIAWWEPVNEPDDPCGNNTQCFYYGTFAQLARLTEDARCIILGSQGGKNVIHQNGNGTATPCTLTAIDPTALILMSPTHAKNTQALDYTQNQLYCSKSSAAAAYSLPCPSPATATATAIDVVIIHMKPGDETGNTCPAPTPCTVESAMAMYAANIRSRLQPAEILKPFWDGEASYAPSGFTSPYTNANPGNQASFFPRFYLSLWTQGISLSAYYTSDEISSQSGTVGQNSTAQAAMWLVNSTVKPCTAVATLWSCSMTDSDSKAHLITWDTSQLCSGASCPTQNQKVSGQWTTYQDMTATSTPIAIAANTVPVGIKPVILNGSSAAPPLPPTNLSGKTT